MLKALARPSVSLVCLLALASPVAAQELVHALTGTVSSIDAAAKTITVFQDNGRQGVYTVVSNPKTRISFDKKIESESTAADAFKKNGSYVIVFYFGESQQPTVAALKSLGTGPFTSTEGKVSRFENRDHSITVQDKSGKMLTFKIEADTVAETTFGAQEGLKFHAQTGDQVRIVSTSVDGNPTALFLREM